MIIHHAWNAWKKGNSGQTTFRDDNTWSYFHKINKKLQHRWGAVFTTQIWLQGPEGFSSSKELAFHQDMLLFWFSYEAFQGSESTNLEDEIWQVTPKNIRKSSEKNTAWQGPSTGFGAKTTS